jgi:hypothetical protein
MTSRKIIMDLQQIGIYFRPHLFALRFMCCLKEEIAASSLDIIKDAMHFLVITFEFKKFSNLCNRQMGL